MPDKYFLDTSYIVALINERDQYHTIDVESSNQFKKGYLITTDAVLFEIGNALSKEHKREAVDVIFKLRAGTNIEVISIDSQLFDKGLKIYKKYLDKTWGLVDCISMYTMKDRNIYEALTFDSDCEQAELSIVK